MVLVNCKWRQQNIINNVESVEIDGIQIFKHVKTEGMRIYFDSKIGDEVRNMDKSSFMEYMLIMEAIMEIPGWAALAISILPVVNDSVFEGYKYTVCRPNRPMDCQRLLK
ncbi:hypothetical protein psyc5s11_27350 [Clostridium gelidum]|uniref:Uncharacterized protein n=1 Tax=Clostridium gelidum TaxID=704125 RepID=A0ABN6IZ09_9CLOT|nr:hypothetical protein [Clostridium gelidum]BCZ46668.1 hypothetical protein psyc5s11_27350 [Clostridium gelidum]